LRRFQLDEPHLKYVSRENVGDPGEPFL
jgi:hypothetical protein